MQNEVARATHEIKQVEQTTCCIVGSGPGGAVLALLLARKGISVILLEEHMDFDRDFRGDTIHPSVMQIMEELGLADRLLQLDHTNAYSLPVQTAKGTVTLADFRRLKTRYPYIALIPQLHFLEFITTEAKRYPNFQLVMGARAEKLIEEDGYIHGVQYRGQDGWHEVRAVLTVGADGRFSRIRRLAGFEPIKTAPPMDVLWFRLPRKPGDPKQSGGVLSVESSRLPRWYRPGLLLIGDAAHVMSPVGGVGINYAIQDAVEAANVLSEGLKEGQVRTRDLTEVQRRRELPTRIIQAFQNFIQQRVLANVLKSDKPLRVSPALLFLLRLPIVRDIPARFIAFGFRSAHVKNP